PTKAVRPGEDSQISTTYADWKEMSGLLTPQRGTVDETDVPSYSWDRKSIQTLNGSDGKEFEPLANGPSDIHVAGPMEPIPFNFDNDHIIFKVGVNKGKPMWWLLDTGADVNVVNTAHLADFGLETYGKTTTTGGGGSADYGYARGATFVFPGVELRNQHVSILDQTGIERAYGMILGGILGYDFLSRFVVEIDYEKLLLTLHDSKNWEYRGSGFVVSITIDDGIPYADATISAGTKDAIPANMIIDFGAAETMTLTAPFVKANDLLIQAGTNSSVNKMAGLENQFFSQTNVRGRINRLVMGGLVVDSFPVNLSVNTKGAFASTSFSGTVGEGIYHRYHIYLDYARNRIILEPTAEASKPYAERKTYGMTLLASGADYHTYTVAGVRAGSPAETDGFRKEDVISDLDGQTSSQFTLAELRKRLAEDGQRHELKVKRGDSTLAKSVEIRRVSIEQK
ncbi:MAG TPA: aspartyl protease family protein, partial [Candidatus Acidoferrum sp.]|nr:aspartyl protease family protein [Candidatus Acidoferrum sp.]